MHDCKMSSSVSYTLALNDWENSAPIVVIDPSGQHLCSVPLDYLTASKVEPVTLLSSIVSMCVAEAGFLADGSGNRITIGEQLQRGELVWQASGESALCVLLEEVSTC